ncbi:MAG: GtrA family protein [Polyangiaceae bacterium]
MRPKLDRVWEIVRSLVAGGAATLADLAVLTACVHLLHWTVRDGNVPALVAGGIVNFVGNRQFAFRDAKHGALDRHVVGYLLVETVALVLNGVLYDLTLRLLPGATHLYWLVRLATSNVVFLLWSYPLWRRVFRAPGVAAAL